MNFFRKLNSITFPDSQEIDESVIDYYEKNPDDLDLIINKEHFHATYLGIVFILGITLTILARIIQHAFGDQLGELVNAIILDVASELGIALFGGAVVAYLIEFLNKHQYQRNIKFRREVKHLLEKRKSQPPLQ